MPDRSIRRRHLGSWSIFCDIAGQVSESPNNPIVTVAAVAVPPEQLKPLRHTLVNRFCGKPEKWKNGKLSGLETVRSLLVKFNLPVVAGTNYVGDQPRWQEFFRDADTFCAADERRRGKEETYLKGHTTLRMRLLCQGFARLVRELLGQRLFRPVGEAQIALDFVADNDLTVLADQALFCETLIDWAENSRLTWDFDIHPLVTASCRTEQEEPLLLLPDYIAGVYHHADPRTRLTRPVVDPVDALQAIVELRKAHRMLYEYERSFDAVYPLQYEGERIILRR